MGTNQNDYQYYRPYPGGPINIRSNSIIIIIIIMVKTFEKFLIFHDKIRNVHPHLIIATG